MTTLLAIAVCDIAGAGAVFAVAGRIAEEALATARTLLLDRIVGAEDAVGIAPGIAAAV
jgi:hypothetical protein